MAAPEKLWWNSEFKLCIPRCKVEDHPDIKLVLIEAEKWERAGQWNFGQKSNINKKVTNCWMCDQSNTNWELCDVSCELPCHLPCTPPPPQKKGFYYLLRKFSIVHSALILLLQICFYTTPAWNKCISHQ